MAKAVARDAAPSKASVESDPDRVVIRFRTVNDSLYEIDLAMMVWRRIARTPQSGDLRAEGGELLAMAPLSVGRSAGLLYLPFDADAVRVLVTSPVVTIAALHAKRVE